MTPEELAAIKRTLVDGDWRRHGRRNMEALIAEVERLRESENEYVVLCDRLSELLTQTAEALKGPPPPLTSHDWSDLPAVAAKLVDHHRQAHHHGMLP